MSHPTFLSGRRSGICAAALLISTSLLLGGCAAGPNSEAKAAETKEEKKVDAVPVEVAVASHRAVAASYTGTAALEPRAESQVVAKTSGVALAVLVEEGQRVTAGQPLVRLDPDRARLAVAQSEAQMRKLENDYQRAQKLVVQQLVSAASVDQLRFDLENVRAQYRLATLELSYTTVVAPISGVIASRSIKTGNFVQINTPIFRIVDNSRLEATLNVPERELATLRAGQPVTLAADALPGQRFTGTVDRIVPGAAARFAWSAPSMAPRMRCSPACSGASASITTSVPMRLWCRAWRCSTTVSRRCSGCAKARSHAFRSSWVTPRARGWRSVMVWRPVIRWSPPARSRCATAPQCR